ncbi:MAG: fused DSP-PTPase phosphatase/NAD kinase-like protein [Desulfobulbaceae bacterium]
MSPYIKAEEYWAQVGGDRPDAWAQPLPLAGVPNLHKVSDDLYRSAQPTGEGMSNLKKLGIETIVNLRSFHSDRARIGNSGLAYEHLYMKAWHPEQKEIIRFFRIISNPKRTPVLVHCQHGADRTGTMTAVYRITVQGWSKEEAIREMKDGSFGFHGIWQNLVAWINSLDCEAIKKESGLN